MCPAHSGNIKQDRLKLLAVFGLSASTDRDRPSRPLTYFRLAGHFISSHAPCKLLAALAGLMVATSIIYPRRHARISQARDNEAKPLRGAYKLICTPSEHKDRALNGRLSRIASMVDHWPPTDLRRRKAGSPQRRVDITTAFSAGLSPLELFFPGQPKSLSGIALRAFGLGFVVGSSSLAIAGIVRFTDSPLWRLPFFLIALSVFHFLEFWTTARRNTLVASTDSFLLTANWPSYAIAHVAAILECSLADTLFPSRAWAPLHSGPLFLAIGLAMVLIGQAVRTAAMLEAGTSFNHQVQTNKAESHRLVTSGIYGLIRHPSYFGFFYWSLGTQLVLGNVVCFCAYAAVLWTFFYRRIKGEESKLVEFFQKGYLEYRNRVGTRMPFIP